MFIVVSILGLIFLILILGKIKLTVQFNKEVQSLFTKSRSISHQTFKKAQIADLPSPVHRYFNHVLRDGQSYISYASIKHDGQFKTGIDKGWVNIKGEQYATTEKPGFIWKGTTSFFVARDMYIAGKGRLVVTLFSLFKVVDGKGPKYDEGELLRWLGESVLYPTNLLPGKRLQWIPVDADNAILIFNYREHSLHFLIRFNEIGEITEMQTKRYMGENNVETWVIKSYHYKEMNQVIIPTRFEVIWRLAKGDFSYAKFNIKEVVYDQPIKIKGMFALMKYRS